MLVEGVGPDLTLAALEEFPSLDARAATRLVESHDTPSLSRVVAPRGR